MPPARTVRGFGFKDKLQDLVKDRGGPQDISHVLAFTDEDGQPPMEVEVRNVRKYAANLMGILGGIKWRKLEVYTKKKQLILAHERCADDESAAGDVEDLAAPVLSASSSGIAQHTAMMVACSQVIFRSQEIALNRQQSGMELMMTGYRDLVTSAMKTFADTDERNRALVHDNHKLTEALIRERVQQLNAGEPGSESSAAMEKVLPMVLEAVLRGGSKPTNGAAAATKKGGTT